MDSNAICKPKVVIVTPYAQFYGGVEIVNHMLKNILRRENYEVKILSREIFGNNLLYRAKTKFIGLNKVLSTYFNHYYAKNVQTVICNGEFSLGLRHPCAVNVFHGCYYGYAQALRPYLDNRSYNYYIKLAEQQKVGAQDKYVVAISKSVAKHLKNQGIKVDEIIVNAIDADKFRPYIDQKRKDRCLFVGSANYYGKGIDILERLADLGVEIDCITNIRPKDRRLRWLGNLSNNNLPRFYSQYKVLLLPSRFEGCSLTVLEAMACGTPVVTTTVGTGEDIAVEIPAFVVNSLSDSIPEQIVERLKEIERNYDYYSKQARHYILRNHDFSLWSKKWLATITAAMKYGCSRSS